MRLRHFTISAALLIPALLPAPSPAGSLPPRGRPAPDFQLKGLDDQSLELTSTRGRTVLLLFGEIYNPNSVAAAHDVAAVLASGAGAEPPATAFMIVTQEDSAAALADEARKAGVTLPVLRDPGRRTFAAYDVMVLPSLVVVNAAGDVVLPCAGYPMDFEALVSDAILLAGGGLSDGEFDQRRGAAEAPQQSETRTRATRLAFMADELARRGSHDLAVAKFAEALALDPDCLSARVGLGDCRLRRGEVAQAEEEFRRALTAAPESADASIGLARVQLIRGGNELSAAQERLTDLVRKHPNDPKVVYLAGLAAEKGGDHEAALGRFKKAAELLLYGADPKRELK